MGDSIITLDFETQAIQRRPQYPPVPVGVAVREEGESHYYAWGHPTGNNCTRKQVGVILKDIWRSSAKLLMHNAKFDLDVAETHFGLKLPDWRRIHDTQFLLFLADPHARDLQLKPSAERLLGMPPDEQDAVREWLVAHKIVRSNDKKWGAHIAEAPGDLVGRYAIGDVERTYKLFKHLHAKHKGAAYDRERQLLPILLRNEQQGIRVDVDALAADLAVYGAALGTAETYIRRVLKAPTLNLDADRDLASALQHAGAVLTWNYTATGQASVAKDALKPEHFRDPKLASALGYRNRLKTCLSTFMQPWFDTAQTNGRVYVGWNQTRGEGGGARTGRLSSSPNLQNLAKSFDDKNDGYEHPKFLKTPQLPLIRKYILPDEGCVIAHRDYNQQELRITAHFEDGLLAEAYNADPRTDTHSYTQKRIEEVTGMKLGRRPVKIVNFLTLYGGGLGKLAAQLGVPVEEARAIRDAQRAALPGVVSLDADLKRMGRKGEFITTWGGRKYFCEPPQGDRTFEYKLLNYLIQGSAADCTKQALINYDQIKKSGRLMLSVHDEANVSVPESELKSEMALLKESMESVKFDVHMLTDGKVSQSNWGELQPWAD